MIPQTLSNNVQTNLSNSNAAFATIEASPEVFRMLSKDIYSHTVAAIVREVTSNAVDSHNMAGKQTTPIHITLPTDLMPVFEVEDFGIGLKRRAEFDGDDLGVEDLYLAYFKSTKKGSNVGIGEKGLGSKTPFTYTDMITVTATYNGTRRVFNVFMNDKGIPQSNMLSEFPYEGSNGLKVSVPVKENDVYKFVEEAKFILGFFPVPIHITNESEHMQPIFTQEDRDLLADGKLVLKNMFYNSSLYGKGIYVVSGGVCYPIKQYNLTSFDSSIYDILNYAMRQGGYCFLNFPLGEVYSALSREALSMSDDDLQAKVYPKFVEALREHHKKIEEDFKKVKNSIEAYNYVFDNIGVTTYPLMYKDKTAYQIGQSQILKRSRIYEVRRGRNGRIELRAIKISYLHGCDRVKILHNMEQVSDFGKKSVKKVFGGNIFGAHLSLCSNKKLSPLRLNRIANILGISVDSIELYDGEEMYNEIKLERRKNRGKVARTPKPKIQTVEAICTGYEFLAKSHNEETWGSSYYVYNERINLSMSRVMYLTYDSDEISVERQTIEQLMPLLVEDFAVDKIYLIRTDVMNPTNKKKLEKIKTYPLEPFYEEIVKAHKKELGMQYIQHVIRDDVFDNEIVTRILLDSKSKLLQSSTHRAVAKITSMVDEHTKVNNLLLQGVSHQTCRVWSKFVSKKILSMLDVVVNDINEAADKLWQHYPLFSRTRFDISKETDDNKMRDHVIEYIKTIDKLNLKGETK